MDDLRFDALVRVLGSGAPRRRVLAGLLASLPLALAGHDAAAKGKGKGKKKKNGKKLCKGGAIRCGKSSQCIDLKNDSSNCGNCGNICGGGRACHTGSCVSCGPDSCSIGLGEECGGGFPCSQQTGTAGTTICADLDRTRCGCTSDQGCVGLTGSGSICVRDPDFPACPWGTCVPPCDAPCPGNGAFCPGIGCRNLQSDREHCGECGNVCDFGQEVCSAGSCDDICDPGRQFCLEFFPHICGNNCACLTSKESDTTICGQLGPSSPCMACETDAECETALGEGSVCIDIEGFCFCEDEPFATACVHPCGLFPPERRRRSQGGGLRRRE